MQRTSLVLTLAVTLALAGCVRYPGGIAPSNVPIDQHGYQAIGPVAASDCKVNLFGILPVSGGNHVADAVDAALRQMPGADALVNITVDRVSKFFILWTQTCTEVRAMAVRLN